MKSNFCTVFALVFALSPAVYAAKRVDCNKLLTAKDFAKLGQTLNDHKISETKGRTAAQRLLDVAQSQHGSQEIVALLTGAHRNEGAWKILSSEGDSAAVDYLMRPENRDLAYRNLDVLWEGLTDSLFSSGGRQFLKSTTPEGVLAFLLDLAKSDPEQFAPKWRKTLNQATTTGGSVGQLQMTGDLHEIFKLSSMWMRDSLQRLAPPDEDEDTHADQTEEDWEVADRRDTLEGQIYVDLIRKAIAAPVNGETLDALLRMNSELSQSEAFAQRGYSRLFKDFSSDTGAYETDRYSSAEILVFYYRVAALFERIAGPLAKPAFINESQKGWQQWSTLYSSWHERASISPEENASRFSQPLSRQAFDQHAIVNRLASDPYFKISLFTKILESGELRSPQRWISVVSPSEASRLVQLSQSQSSKFKNIFGQRLRERLSIKVADLSANPNFLKFYPDEILDSLAAAYKETNQQWPGSKDFVDPSQTKIRYIRRQLSELALGEKTGDCTSVGSVNYGPSTTWFYNPAYQMITFSRGGRFLGKMNFALIDVGGRPAILIDALEFNPQALPNKPYYAEAKIALDDALAFVSDVARAQGRDLYGLAQSNSSEANEILKTRALPDPEAVRPVRVLFDEKFVRDFLQLPANILLRPYYQTLSGYGVEVAESQTEDKKLHKFEIEIVNPAQIRDPEIGRLLADANEAETQAERDRLLEQAAKRVQSDDANNLISQIYGVAPGLSVSWKFLAARLNRLFPSQRLNARPMSQVFNLSKKSNLVLLYKN